MLDERMIQNDHQHENAGPVNAKFLAMGGVVSSKNFAYGESGRGLLLRAGRA
jgi:hypothetical protein